MNNASPLIIIDGMEGSLNAINPQDIENISILKMQLLVLFMVPVLPTESS